MARLSRHHCDRCGRQLPEERWIWSSWTKSRYCYVGEGCFGKKIRGKKRGAAKPPVPVRSTNLAA